MEPKAFLTAMANLYETNPERWTHGAFARDKKGKAVDTLAPNAFSFSANGFFERSVGEGLLDERSRDVAWDLFLGAVSHRHGHRFAVQVNDVDGREAVVACAREAAK